MIHKHFLPMSLYRGLEIAFLCSLIIIQPILIFEKRIMKSMTIDYTIIQLVLFGILLISFGDICFGLILDYFPLINFLLRPIIQILLIRNLRQIWFNMFYLIYLTRNVFFLLFCTVVCFGIIGYFLFSNVSSDFSSVFESMYSMFILLSTCNFPDVMLGTLTQNNKSSVLFFVCYILLNYFIIFSLLKSMYYSSFFQAFITKAKNAIDIIKSKGESNEFAIEDMQLFLCGLSKRYYLSMEEYNDIFHLLRIEDIEGFSLGLRKYLEGETKKGKNPFAKFLNNKWVEAIINIIDFMLLFFLFNVIVLVYPIVAIIQLIWCSLFIFEYLYYVYNLGLKRMILTEYLRTLFFIINGIIWVLLLISSIMTMTNRTQSKILITTLQTLLILRLVRIILFLKKFNEFKIIFRTLNHMKTIYYGLISALFSFFFLFSSISMLLTGGNHTETDFNLIKDIPDNYVHINFNDYCSAFVSCFCLTMVNNINIIARSLSYHNHEYFKAYFATFYYFSTLIILNICQTLLLEMYFTIKEKKSLSR